MRRLRTRIVVLRLRRAVTLAAGLAPFLLGPRAAASSAADELVRQARAHEQAHEEDVAARRYTEALTIDATNEDAWLGLGDLRRRLGEIAEAERVYGAALQRVPTLRRALEGRALCAWALGRHADAETDLRTYAESTGDVRAFRELADWFGADGRSPAQLATGRVLLAIASDRKDSDLLTEARRMVRALVVLVDAADPASSPPDLEATRRELAQIARAVR